MKHLLDAARAHPVHHLEVDDPTHEAMEMPGEAVITMRNEIMATASAMIHCCPAVDDPSPDPSFCYPQVEGALELGAPAPAMRPLPDRDPVYTPSLRTLFGCLTSHHPHVSPSG